MKRLWLGSGILGVLLVLSLLACWSMRAIHAPVAQALEQANDAALAENWAQAEALCRQAKEDWQKYWHFTATLADHTPMDELDGLFAELDIYLQAREQPHFSATCRRLAQLAEAMADNHSLSLWSIL